MEGLINDFKNKNRNKTMRGHKNVVSLSGW